MSGFLGNLHFLRPYWLLLIIPAAALCLLLWRRRQHQGSWEQAVAPELLAHLLQGSARRQRRLTLPALFTAWCAACIGAAGPAWEQLPQPVLQRQDALVIVLDLSYSLLATDLSPTRNDAVRRKLLDLLRQREEGLTALVAYAGDAHIVAPLTDDHDTIANLLPALSPDMMPLPGSNPVDGIERALQLLESAAVRSGRLLLVTDGINTEDRDALARRLQSTGHRLAVLGVGTDIGAPIPLPGGGFVKDGAGNIVIPALKPGPLRDLAATVGGVYRRITVDDQDLSDLLGATEGGVGDATVTLDRRSDEWQDMGHWLVLALLPAALLLFRRGWIYSLALLVVLPSPRAEASLWSDLWLRPDQQAQRTLNEGDAAAAAERFEDPAWRGTAAFEAGDYASARRAFSAADEDADSWYNRGNALAAEGRLEEALDAYRETLRRDPDAEDAARNIETLERLLEEQQQEQSQQSQGPQDGSPSDGSPQSENEQQRSDEARERGDDGQPQRDGEEQGSAGDPEHGESPDGQDPEGDQQRDAEEAGEQESAEDAAAGEEQEPREAPQAMSPRIDNSAMQEALERDQALEQWLRRVPDDPSGLLREKFRYESRQRQQNGETKRDGQIW